MGKQINPNIGHIICGHDGCTHHAALRQDRGGKYYYDCPTCGRIKPNYPGGQDKVINRATIWGAGGPTADCPTWIAEQWSMQRVWQQPGAAVEPYGGTDPEPPPTQPTPPRTPAPQPAPPPPPQSEAEEVEEAAGDPPGPQRSDSGLTFFG